MREYLLSKDMPQSGHVCSPLTAPSAGVFSFLAAGSESISLPSFLISSTAMLSSEWASGSPSGTPPVSAGPTSGLWTGCFGGLPLLPCLGPTYKTCKVFLFLYNDISMLNPRSKKVWNIPVKTNNQQSLKDYCCYIICVEQPFKTSKEGNTGINNM